MLAWLVVELAPEVVDGVLERSLELDVAVDDRRAVRVGLDGGADGERDLLELGPLLVKGDHR